MKATGSKSVRHKNELIKGLRHSWQPVSYTHLDVYKRQMQYKVPSRLDIGKVQVEFECSYETTGPFGAKSIGEIVINTPSPALSLIHILFFLLYIYIYRFI